MRRIAIFDFDGTLTQKDTFIEFIKYAKGIHFYYISLFLLSPVLILYLAGIISNKKAKEMIFAFHFKNMLIHKFEDLCSSFNNRIDEILNWGVYQKMIEHSNNKDELIIISASVENWILPWAASHGVNTVLGTKIEVKSDKITGKFSSPNCYGIEKVNRLISYLGELSRKDLHLTAYGNSRGDADLMNYADAHIWCGKNR